MKIMIKIPKATFNKNMISENYIKLFFKEQSSSCNEVIF